jgi:hypothetical protein
MAETVDDSFPSPYLASADVGTGKKLIIDKVVDEELGADADVKPVAYFVGVEKGCVLNKTNANKIAEITGSRTYKDWAGKEVVLYTAMVQFRGKESAAIRIKAPA